VQDKVSLPVVKMLSCPEGRGRKPPERRKDTQGQKKTGCLFFPRNGTFIRGMAKIMSAFSFESKKFLHFQKAEGAPHFAPFSGDDHPGPMKVSLISKLEIRQSKTSSSFDSVD
jgi:hypothetical protein